jgi:branched-chain amino acid transport system permease protein
MTTINKGPANLPSTESEAAQHDAQSAALGRTEPRLFWVLGALVLITLYMTAVEGSFNLFLFNSFLLAGIGASALNIPMGQAGLVSVASAAFLCAGSFTAVIAERAGWPPLLAIVTAAVVGAVAGSMFSLPSARLDHLYFALSTLAAQALVIYLATEYQRNEVGEAGFITVPWFTDKGVLGKQQWWAWLLTAVLAAVLYLVRCLRSGRAGRAWRHIRDHELAAASTGVRVRLWKASAMGLSSALIAVQGALTFYFSGSASAGQFTFLISVQYIAMILLGGVDTLMGPLIGAAIIVFTPTISNDVVSSVFGADVASRDGAQIAQMLYGVLIILAIVGPKSGLDGLVRRALRGIGSLFRSSRRLVRS